MRERGQRSFIVRYGILRFGVLAAALGALDRYFGILPGSAWRGIPRELFGFVFTSIFAGALMGWLMWRWSERVYERQQHAAGVSDGTPTI
jgi:hypothetical protein